jgi:hypothetical protein
VSEKHYVIVQEFQARPYLAKGYERSDQTAEQRLGAAWAELPHDDRRDLVVLEIDAAKAAELNDTHAKKYRMYFGRNIRLFDSVSMASVRVLEEWDDGSRLIAREDCDSPAESCGAHDLYDTPRECVENMRGFLLDKIAQFRRAANTLETFLKHTENL